MPKKAGKLRLPHQHRIFLTKEVAPFLSMRFFGNFNRLIMCIGRQL